MNASNKCKCAHHYTIPVLIILLALAVLLGNLNIISAELVGILWPIALILIGCSKMCYNKCRCCSGCGCGCVSSVNKDQSCTTSC